MIRHPIRRLHTIKPILLLPHLQYAGQVGLHLCRDASGTYLHPRMRLLNFITLSSSSLASYCPLHASFSFSSFSVRGCLPRSD